MEKNRKIRITYLDTTKGMFVLAMVMAHIIQFFGAADPLMKLFSDGTNLAAFSGFMFCFGYGCYLAYFRKEKTPRSRMFKNSFKILIAFYISGISYRFFVDKSIDLPGII
ncbi:MAG: heparan-alpha-glucosaminide N-acetyltransferase domain-containing protein, partial [Desulfobacterales bacterium]